MLAYTTIDEDFRVKFNRMADSSTMTIDELALLLQRTRRAVEYMRFKGLLPNALAIPGTKRVVWAVGTIREWLDDLAAEAKAMDADRSMALDAKSHEHNDAPRGRGRPRKIVTVSDWSFNQGE